MAAAPAITTAGHSSPLGRWELTSRRPHSALAGIVESYTGYAEWARRPVRRREVAQPSVAIIFNLGPPLIVGGEREPASTRDSFVAGRIDLYGVTEFERTSRCLQLDMTPFGAHAFLGVPMDELSAVVCPIGEVLGRLGDDLVARIEDASGWEERFDLLDRVIARRVAEAKAPSPDVLWAWHRLRSSAGQAPIATLTEKLGCSRRHLSSRFREQIGVTPKTASRVLRFSRSVDLLSRDDGRRFAEIAASCGYFDQAHMNREFRELSGTTPGSFVASRLPSGLGIGAEPQVTSVQDTELTAA